MAGARACTTTGCYYPTDQRLPFICPAVPREFAVFTIPLRRVIGGRPLRATPAEPPEAAGRSLEVYFPYHSMSHLGCDFSNLKNRLCGDRCVCGQVGFREIREFVEVLENAIGDFGHRQSDANKRLATG